MDCERHPGQEAIGRCLECGKGICSQCVTETSQVLVCPECFQREVGRIATAMGTTPGAAPKARKEKPPKVRKPKKGEPPAAPEAPPPAPAFVQQPVTPLLDVVPTEEQPPPVEVPPAYVPPVETTAPPTEQVPVEPKGKAKKEKRKRAKKEKPPKEKAPKKGKAASPPPFMPPPTGALPEEGPPPAFEPPPEEQPLVEAPSVGFEEGEGMMEQVRPEQITEEDFLPSPEHEDIMGGPKREVVVPGGEAGEAAPVEQISDVTVTGEEAEIPEADLPVEGAPGPEAVEEPTPPPPPPPPFEGDQGAGAGEPAPPEPPPTRKVGADEELDSFFFKDEVDKEGKDKEENEETFWE